MTRRKGFKRLPPAYPPAISEAMRELIEREIQLIEGGNTEGLDRDQTYVAVRVLQDGKPAWMLSPSPFLPSLFVDAEVLFVAAVTLAQAVHLRREGAELREVD